MSDLLNKSYKLSEDIVARHNQDGSTVVMKMDESNVFFKIEGVAGEIWKYLSEGKTANESIQMVLSEYDVEQAQLESDTSSFLQTLIDKELIQTL